MRIKWKSNWNSIENQMRLNWNSNENQLKVKRKSIENQLKIKWNSNETQMKLNGNQLKLMNNQLKINRNPIEKIKWTSNEHQSKINRKSIENQIENPIETVEMKVIQLKADRRITNHPTFHEHLLGLLGKPGHNKIASSDAHLVFIRVSFDFELINPLISIGFPFSFFEISLIFHEVSKLESKESRNKLARAVRNIFHIVFSWFFSKKLLTNWRAQRGKIFKYIIDLSWFFFKNSWCGNF